MQGVGLGVGFLHFPCRTASKSNETDGVSCKMHRETARLNSVLSGRLLGTPNGTPLQPFPLAPVACVSSGRVFPKVRSLCSFCPGLGSFCPVGARSCKCAVIIIRPHGNNDFTTTKTTTPLSTAKIVVLVVYVVSVVVKTRPYGIVIGGERPYI